ncbi:MAG: phosphoribosylformylglycinamidine cyclo-ligase, partial [Parcubacteria group bacterium]|nr:phosphoribosylformylglycinamidine cyclo-ligase [Parcubacteria group bacterium]
ITLGALPVSLGQHLAVGDSGWFNDAQRRADLIEGTRKACILARCAWGPGETSTLRDIIIPGASELSGAAIGWIEQKNRVFDPRKIRHGDAIILLESSGIHANGLTMARKITDKLPDRYLTRLDDGRTYGETLLDATHIYVGIVEDCLNRGVKVHYAVNITGHGWRKLMRATQSFAYIVECLPRQLPIFGFLQKHGPVDDAEAYGNLNMGAGFALFVPEIYVTTILETAASHHIGALRAGHIERSDHKKVVIKPKGLEYSGSTLGVR